MSFDVDPSALRSLAATLRVAGGVVGSTACDGSQPLRFPATVANPLVGPAVTQVLHAVDQLVQTLSGDLLELAQRLDGAAAFYEAVDAYAVRR